MFMAIKEQKRTTQNIPNNTGVDTEDGDDARALGGGGKRLLIGLASSTDVAPGGPGEARVSPALARRIMVVFFMLYVVKHRKELRFLF